MKISDMTIFQLRRALRERVLSAEGSKADLEIRLRVDLEEDLDHLNKDEYEYEDAVSGDLKLLLTAQSEKLRSNIKEVFEDLSNEISELINGVDKVYKPNCNEVQGAASDLEYKAEGQTTLKANCTALCNGNAINEDNLNSDDSHLDNIQTGPLTVEQKNDFIKTPKQFPEVVTERIGYTTTTTHKIICKSEEPIKQRPYSINPDKRAFIYKEVQEMKNEGLI